MRIVCLISVLALCGVAIPAAAQEKPKPSAPEKAKPDNEPDLINPDRPGIADGSTVIGKGRFQIETGVQSEFRSDGRATEHRLFAPTLFRIGINDKWEGRVEGNGYTWSHMSDPINGSNRTDGYAPISIGFKRHCQDSKGIKHPSVGSIFRLFVPSGSSDFGSRRFQGDARIVADWDLNDSWSLNPNVGMGCYDDGQSSVFATALIAMTVNYFNKSKTVNPFVDVGLQGPEEKKGKTSVIVDAGIAYILSKDLQLDASVGTGVLGRTPPHPFWSFGVSWRH